MPVTKTNDTYRAEIYCGLVPGYKGTEDPDPSARLQGVLVGQRILAVNICREYCDEVGLGVTVSNMELVYTGGREQGVVVGLFDYPRFPKGSEAVREHALELADRLLVGLRQERLSVVCDDVSYLIEGESISPPEAPEDPTMLMDTADVATAVEKLKIQHARTLEMDVVSGIASSDRSVPDFVLGRSLRESEEASDRALSSAREAERNFEMAANAMEASGLKHVGELVQRFRVAAQQIRNQHDDTVEALAEWKGQ